MKSDYLLFRLIFHGFFSAMYLRSNKERTNIVAKGNPKNEFCCVRAGFPLEKTVNNDFQSGHVQQVDSEPSIG